MELTLNDTQQFSHVPDGIGRVWFVDWDPAGTRLASCGDDSNVRIWKQLGSRWEVIAVLKHHNRTVRQVKWNPKLPYIAVASFDSSVTIWAEITNNSWELLTVLEGHDNEVKSIAWNFTGELLATCSRDKSVWIWERDDNDFDCLAVLTGHKQDVKHVEFHPTDKLLVSCGYDNEIRMWEPDDDGDWVCSQVLRDHTDTVWDVTFDMEGEKMVSCSGDRTVRVWERGSEGKWNSVFVLPSDIHADPIYSIDWHSTGTFISTACGDRKMRIFTISPSTNEMKLISEGDHETDVNCVKWNPQIASRLITCSDDNMIKIWYFNGPNIIKDVK